MTANVAPFDLITVLFFFLFVSHLRLLFDQNVEFNDLCVFFLNDFYR